MIVKKFNAFLSLAFIVLTFLSHQNKIYGMDTHDALESSSSPQASKKLKKDPVKNEMDRLELLGALRTVVSETCKSVEELDSLNDTRVMILGTTGAGKSTLIHQLVGRDVFAAYPPPPNERSLKLFVKPNDQIGEEFVIGHGKTSCTTNPNAYHDKENKVIWWDCPGFLDNKGIIQEFSNQLAVSKLFTGEKPSKILLVAEQAKFKVARSRPVWDAVEAIVTMFKDSNGSDDDKILQDLKNSLVFVVTHAPKDFDLGYELGGLIFAPPDMASDIAKDLMEYFSSNVNIKCFTSFSPSEEGLVKLDARTKILRALVETPGSHLVARQAAVDPYAKQCAEAVTNQIRHEIDFHLSVYIDSITSNITFDTPLSDLVCFDKFFTNVKTIADNNLVDDTAFLDALEKTSVENPSLHLMTLIANVRSIADVHPFLMKFGASQLKIGRSWKSSSVLALDLVKRQKKSSELINEQKNESVRAAKKHAEDLAEQQKKHSEQLADETKLKEGLKSENESVRVAAKESLDKLSLAIAAAEKENKEKEKQYKDELEARESKEKLEREKAEKEFNEKANKQKELYKEKYKQKKEQEEKIVKLITEKAASASVNEKGVFVHMGRGVDNAIEKVTDGTGSVVKDLFITGGVVKDLFIKYGLGKLGELFKK